MVEDFGVLHPDLSHIKSTSFTIECSCDFPCVFVIHVAWDGFKQLYGIDCCLTGMCQLDVNVMGVRFI